MAVTLPCPGCVCVYLLIWLGRILVWQYVIDECMVMYELAAVLFIGNVWCMFAL